MESGYPFTFVGIDSHCIDDYQKDSLVYNFESRKSHHQYIVRIERYVEDLRDWFETAEYERLSMFVLLNLEAMPLPAQRYELLQKIDQFVGTF